MFWDSPYKWREAQLSLDYHLHRYAGRRWDLKALADAVAQKIIALDPVMDALCAQTCPGCKDPCCGRATVRYDFRDLVFLHINGKGLPVSQLETGDGRACSCLGENGCSVERLLRPFMCTWYLCPGQAALLRNEVWRGYDLPERLREIQKDRKELEKGFLALVGPY